ncbi:MAG: DNA polymerase III subunit gamma/tau [Hyphomicrobiales bacterium]|nr:MAG: DNA polymerase III subunit gamma/tau [Hyphomicrobiales bacterium]
MADPTSTETANAGEAPDNGAYRVLARKYRPADFNGLIGQDAMVRTLTNAFEYGRIAQAFMLTGVRGVGKTTTARILARALNYTGADGQSGPSIHMEGYGEHCQAIMESRHIDVMEMDAASHTGIDDIREIIEAVKYKPASARYKVYIIDEVHMLSRQAFNGLLKTLEEPPEHVKFIFATTEIRKVPVTVLSRCQRFDLRRINADLLVSHFAAIAKQEQVKVGKAALAMIARAAEGSVRDGLSLLDQAIALGGGRVDPEDVRHMLGLADRGRIIELFDHVMHGRAGKALEELKSQYDAGADPAVVLSDMADFIHFVTRLKVAGKVAALDAAMSQTEIERGKEMAAGLEMSALARAWQMVLKGLTEVRSAGRPLAAADMVLVRMAYAANMPAPDDLLRRLGKGPGPAESVKTAPATPAPAPQPGPVNESPAPESPASETAPAQDTMNAPAPPAPTTPPAMAEMDAPEREAEMETGGEITDAPESFTALVALAGARRNLRLKTALETQVRLVRFEPGRLELNLLEGAPRDLPGMLADKLKSWTGTRWMVVLSQQAGEATLDEQRRASEAARKAKAAELPEVRQMMELFPGAEIVEVLDEEAGEETQADNRTSEMRP